MNVSDVEVSVVIPARNEAAVLPACLARLLNQQDVRGMHVIVSANACTDDTADIARSYVSSFEAAGHRLSVIECAPGGKPAALNAADALIDGGIRIYLDADVVLSRNAVAEVTRLLGRQGGIHLAVPRLRVAPSASGVTRWYGRTWANLPYIRHDVIGCGFYAVSEEGRSRWGRFPSIISDDKFVRLHFARHERAVAEKAYFQIQLPEGLRELVNVRGRWCRGNHELSRTFPALARQDKGRYRQLIGHFGARPSTWPCVPIFVGVYLLAEVAAFWKRRVGLGEWERAERARHLLKRLPGARARRAATPVQRTAVSLSPASGKA